MKAFKNIEAVLWDLDNTITDSGDNHFYAWDAILKKYKVPLHFTRDKFDSFYGMNNSEVLDTIFKDYFAKEDRKRISVEKEIEFRKFAVENPDTLLPGVHDWLKYNESKGLIQAVASSAPMKNIIVQLQTLGIGDFFRVISSGYPLPEGKPHPQVFLNAAAGLGKSPENCLVIEDTLHGIEAALRGGMHCVLVRNEDPREKEQILKLADTYARIKHQYLCIVSLAEIAPSTILE